MRKAYKILLESLKGRDHSEDVTVRWEDNIKIEPKKLVTGGADSTDLAQDRYRWRALVNTVMNLRVP
jgi:hypothetical protein